jgi:hypothetical protein
MHSPTIPDTSAARASLAGILRTYGHERLELEFRLGHRTAAGAHGKSNFVPGVSEAAWHKLKSVLDASPKFDSTSSVTRERMCDATSRGTAKYVTTVGAGGQELEPHWMHKKRLCDIDADTGSTWCCRTSMSLEEREPAPAPPASHKFERHKERWSYRYRCWSIDLTRVTSNLPHELDNDAMTYEVEIELSDTAELFSRELDNLLEWGWSIVHDACEFMRDA